MNTEIKRRLFLSGIVGSLIGLPIAVRLIGGKRTPSQEHRFSTLLKKYQQLTTCQITKSDGPAKLELPLRPPVGAEWRYVFFSPTFFPNEISFATGNDPDAFFVRDGVLLFDRNLKGQTVITGGDVYAGQVTAVGDDEKDKKIATIMLQNDKLVAAKPKGTSAPSTQDLHLSYLLGLPRSHSQELHVGMKWTGPHGRLKPYTGFTTQYEVAGYAEIDGRKTLDIRFQGVIPNIVGRPGVNSEKPEKDASANNKHQGHCYFDLETGFLVRQETEMETLNTGIKGFVANDGSHSIAIRSTSIVQVIPS